MSLLDKQWEKNKTKINFIVEGGMFIALAVIFQSAPVFLPLLGMALSPFATLPIVLAAIRNASLGLTVYVGSSLILSLISLEESMIFVFTTGILGLVIGILLYRKGFIVTTIISGGILSLGITILTFIIGFFQLDDLVYSVSVFATILIFTVFSLSYAFVWVKLIKKLAKHINVLKITDIIQK